MFHYAYITILCLTLVTEIVTAACPENCNSCDERDHCTSCKPGKWGLDIRCQHSCVGSCFNTECNEETGYCIACKYGLYGLKCQHNCSLCEDGQCDLLGCTKGCNHGYYEYKNNVERFCGHCSANCRSCINNIVCSVCNDGFHLYKHEVNGNIVVQCVQCPFGDTCSSTCVIQDCNQCNILSDSLSCTKCRNRYRFNGEICIPNENNCTQGCPTDCDENKTCLGGCNVGWTGERCSDLCASRCLKCHKNNANVCEECKENYYTVTCDVKCSSSCLNLTGKQTCRINDGFCLNGCENKVWGQFCNQSCSNGCADDGVTQVCDRNNGTCKNGCNDGYSGDKCVSIVTSERPWINTADTSRDEIDLQTIEHVTPTTKTPRQSEISRDCQDEVNSDKSTYFVVGYFSGFGTAVFVAAVSAALYHLRRRYVSKKPDTSNEFTGTSEMSTYYNENAAQTLASLEGNDNDANNYERLGNNRNTDKVYSELEGPDSQKSIRYQNIDIPKRQ